VGIGLATVGSARDVRKVLALPLRPAGDTEMARIKTRLAGGDPWENAAEDFGWFLERQQMPLSLGLRPRPAGPVEDAPPPITNGRTRSRLRRFVPSKR